MLIKSIFAGFGGQGVLSIGLNLAQAAMQEGKNVTYLPSYGAEVRGGTANCTVAVSDEEIASPVASSPDFVVAMNQPSVVRFQNQIQSGGVLFTNSSLVEIEITRGDIDIVKVPARRQNLQPEACRSMWYWEPSAFESVFHTEEHQHPKPATSLPEVPFAHPAAAVFRLIPQRLSGIFDFYTSTPRLR